MQLDFIGFAKSISTEMPNSAAVVDSKLYGIEVKQSALHMHLRYMQVTNSTTIWSLGNLVLPWQRREL